MSEESPRNRGAEPTAEDAELALEPTSGPPTEAKLFMGLAVFFAVLAVIYAVSTGYTGGVEYAGTLALVAGAGFSGFFGVFLTLSLRRVQKDIESLEEDHAAGDAAADHILYLPSQSIWPIGLGFGASLIGAGIPLGLWVLIPGVALFTHSLIGWANQSRERS